MQDETWIAEEDRAQPSYLDTLTKKMADSLLANSLEIQVPGPGAAREGDFFESQRRERAARLRGIRRLVTLAREEGGEKR